ncbi:MAG TPA: riboflavin kinase [Verrucomicrobiae bacterium]|nr:riboflavin kinase [Verrucomicrobiae bacterium]
MKDKPVSLQGTVIRFAGNGRKLGYPTANLAIKTGARDGVYFGFADLVGFTDHPSVIFVGIPTTMGDRRRRVEAHLLDIPDEDYYDQPLTLRLEHYHRPNQTFDSREELINIMQADEAAARQWFGQQSGREAGPA